MRLAPALAVVLLAATCLAPFAQAEGAPRSVACTAGALPAALWQTYAARFIGPDGRIVDDGNDGISHSEGQGLALLLAEAMGDRHTFDRVWDWTQRHLRVRDDALFAWRWDPQQGVTDPNNATDGDLLIAWALARAGTRWGDAGYADAAAAIALAVRQSLVREQGGLALLLPGAAGFEHATGTVLNLSYYVFPAFAVLDRVDPAPQWHDLRRTGVNLLQRTGFGRWALPPDWLQWSAGASRLAEQFPPRFGYAAVRIPLYLLWAGIDDPELLKPYRDFWGFLEGGRVFSAWTNLDDDSIDSHGAPTGVRAVALLTRLFDPDHPGAVVVWPELAADETYYSATLALAARLVAIERCAA